MEREVKQKAADFYSHLFSCPNCHGRAARYCPTGADLWEAYQRAGDDGDLRPIMVRPMRSPRLAGKPVAPFNGPGKGEV